MALRGELDSLLEKRLKHDLKAAEIVQATLLSTVMFAVTVCVCCLSVRSTMKAVYLFVLIFFAVFDGTLVWMAVDRYWTAKSSRNWIVLAGSSLVALSTGWVVGNHYWYENTARYFTLRDMAVYVDIDPSSDRGQSFMDAGTIYFKEGSYVDRKKPIGFRNGLNYCVAPIVSTSLTHNITTDGLLNTYNGFEVPRSGAVDFWAVGTDCCGETFWCDDAQSQVARSGLRSLDEHYRAMYLLAVQEWSATSGLPVRQPIFVNWVKDPLTSIDNIIDQASTDIFYRVLVFFGASFVLSYVAHFMLQKVRVI